MRRLTKPRQILAKQPVSENSDLFRIDRRSVAKWRVGGQKFRDMAIYINFTGSDYLSLLISLKSGNPRQNLNQIPNQPNLRYKLLDT